MYGDYLKCLISFIVAPNGAFFILSPLAFDRFHDDINFCCMTFPPEGIKEIAIAKVNVNVLECILGQDYESDNVDIRRLASAKKANITDKSLYFYICAY